MMRNVLKWMMLSLCIGAFFLCNPAHAKSEEGIGKGQEKESHKYEESEKKMKEEKYHEKKEKRKKKSKDKGHDSDKDGDNDKDDDSDRDRHGKGDNRGDEGRKRAAEKATDRGQGEKKGRPWWQFFGKDAETKQQ